MNNYAIFKFTVTESQHYFPLFTFQKTRECLCRPTFYLPILPLDSRFLLSNHCLGCHSSLLFLKIVFTVHYNVEVFCELHIFSSIDRSVCLGKEILDENVLIKIFIKYLFHLINQIICTSVKASTFFFLDSDLGKTRELLQQKIPPLSKNGQISAIASLKLTRTSSEHRIFFLFYRVVKRTGYLFFGMKGVL